MANRAKSSSLAGSTIAALVGLVVCPSCIPALAALIAANVPWAFKYWQLSYLKPAFLIAVGISFAGLLYSWRRHRNPLPLVIAGVSAAAFYVISFVKYYTLSYSIWVAAPLVGLVGASVLNLVLERRCTTCKVPNTRPAATHEPFWTCPECSLRYPERSWAEKCEAWCKEHKSCNLDITAHAVKD